MMMTYHFENIPEELRKLRQWVCWRSMPGENGKIKKLPVNAETGSLAKSNDPETWTDFNTAIRESHNYSGLGFMFAPPYFGVDIDGAAAEIERFRKDDDGPNIIAEFIHTLRSYAEYSVSGNGIHIICRGKLPPNGRRKGNVEMYQDGRFFIMTGNKAADYPIEDCTERIKPLHEKYIGSGREPTTGIVTTGQINLDDNEVVEAARKSKQGATFTDLYEGHWDKYYTSQSQADMALANMLAFWCRCDIDQMDRIFRSSGLMRDKWDRPTSGSTYGKITLKKAIRECKNVYEPKPQYSVSFGRSEKKEKKLYTFDDMGNAARLSDSFRDSILYCYTYDCWFYYDGRCWERDQTGIIERLCDQLIEEMKHDLNDYLRQPCDQDKMEKDFYKHIRNSRSNRAKRAMISEAKHHVPILPSEMDTHHFLLNTLNGTLNLHTGELREHNPKHYLTKMTLCEYTDKADCPRWIKFLNDIFGGKREMLRYIQKAVGYSLTGSTEEQCMFLCYGTGHNGKSTFLNVLSDIAGSYAVNIQPDTIMLRYGSKDGANSDIARLKGARLVTSAEPNEGMRINEGLLKQLTGGDKVTARYMYKELFEFTPEFKLWMAANHKPVIRGTDTGIWRRMHLIPFTVQIPEEQADHQLPYKLQEEYSAILAWAVEGCLLWQKEGLEMPSAVQDAVKEYRSEMDVVSAWLDECCTLGDGREKTTDLYQSYVEWANENNEYKLSSRKFGQEMAKRFERTKSNSSYYYNGLLLSERPYQINIGVSV